MTFKRFIFAVLVSLVVTTTWVWRAEATPKQIVALGDSLTAGFGVGPGESFPEKLEAALKAKGYDVVVTNAGVSGDTSAGGLSRLDWSVPDGTDLVIVELGANDMLRGIAPTITRKNLDAILAKLSARKIAVLLAGMRSAPNLGADYAAAFDSIYPDLARRYGTALYPFFLDGVAAQHSLIQADGLHPNPQGVDIIVQHFMPVVEATISKLPNS